MRKGRQGKRNKERREEKKKAHHPSPKQGQSRDPDQKLEALLVFMLVCCARRRSVHLGQWSRVEEKNPGSEYGRREVI